MVRVPQRVDRLGRGVLSLVASGASDGLEGDTTAGGALSVDETKRTFIAIELAAPVRARFEELQRLLRPAGADVRWVRPDRAHLTLKFLGEAAPEQIEAMQAALDELAPATPAFEVAFRGVGVFPDERRPRVLWVGIVEGLDELRALAEAVDERAVAAGFERERRRFAPHVTLGRFRSASGLEPLRERMQSNASFDAGRMHAGEVHLIHSILGPEGPTYTALHTVRFRAVS
jgi:2'-5' RNA ligase